MNKDRNIENTSMLTASFPESAMLEPSLNNPKMFYCGMNWDKLVKSENRHSGLFQLLDDTGEVKFFGPDIMPNWGGIRPWEGYKCYQYPIPWDGFSILQEINECGVCLVISSDIHRRAGAVTNRAYEACAAGAVMISDNNEFMMKHFKDAALFIYYNKNNPQDTFNQLMEKFNWIKSHREEALELVKRAQSIFRKKFALDKQLLKIVENHPKRFQTISNDLFAIHTNKKVLVTYVLNTLDANEIYSKLAIVIENIRKQYYYNITLVIAADYRIVEIVENFVENEYSNVKIFSLELFDLKNVRQISDGYAIREIQKSFEFDYFVNSSAREIWNYDHITTLIRSIEDEPDSLGAYSGRLFKDSANNYNFLDWFNVFSDMDLASFNNARTAETPGQFMFRKEANRYIPDYMMSLLDGLEHMAYMNILQIKNNRRIVFSKRMTIVDNGYIYDDRKTVVKYINQVRLIRDVIRFELKSKTEGGDWYHFGEVYDTPIDIKKEVKRHVLELPLKDWMRYKVFGFVARIFRYKGWIGQKYLQKSHYHKHKFIE